MSSPEPAGGRPRWTARLWVHLMGINLLATSVVVISLTLFIASRASSELAALSPTRFASLRNELQRCPWQGMVELLKAVDREILGTAVLGAVLALGFALLLSATFSRYVARLDVAIRRMAAGDFQVRIQPRPGPYELGVLEHGLNRTAEHLEHLEAERQFEGAAIAHELRTPITALRLRILGLQDGIYPLTATELEPLNRQLEHLETLAESLQTLTLADAGRLSLPLEWLAIEQVFESLQVTFSAPAAKRKIELTFRVLPGAMVYSNHFQLQKALGNLIENALNHTPAGGQVHVEATLSGDHTLFCVTDTGPGVPDAALGRLFERFYRLDESRARHSGGSGLGLALVQAITHAHGGRVQARRGRERGLRVEIELPMGSNARGGTAGARSSGVH